MFDRATVQGILTPSDQAEITITGKVAGLDFTGSDTIRVIKGGTTATMVSAASRTWDISWLGCWDAS
jgi:hypothetical protein